MDENISSGFCNGKFSLILICKSALIMIYSLKRLVQNRRIGMICNFYINNLKNGANRTVMTSHTFDDVLGPFKGS
jgi:hypothetical protein